MLEPNKNDSKSVTSTKPVEIFTDLTQNTNQVQLRKEELSIPLASQQNETSSYSAYASAESSPNQNSLLASAESANQLRSKSSNTKSATSSSSSLNSYLTIDNSRLMDDLAAAMFSSSGRATPTNNKDSKVETPQHMSTEPFYEITTDHVNKNFLEDEFQSLPPSFIDESKQLRMASEHINFNVIDNDLVSVNLKQTNQTTVKSVTINDIINKEVKSQLNSNVNTSLDKSLNEKSSSPPTPTPTPIPTQTTTSPSNSSKIIKSTLAFLNLFSKNSEKPTETSTTNTSSTTTLQQEITKVTESTKLNNPPQVKPAETNSSLSATKLVTSGAITSASSPNPDCSPYKLLLNELPSKTNAVVVNDFNSRTTSVKTLSTSEGKENQSKPNLIESLASLNHKESDKIDPILTGANKTEKKSSETDKKTEKHESNKSETKVDHVPASSQEFCMNLNFNLAAAAAATAAGPVVVESMKASPEHIRYTSNASTSSIHNDLKLILEESKDTNKSLTQASLASKSVPRTKSNEKQTTDADRLNLIKIMLNMVEANKQNCTKLQQQKQQDQPVINWPKKENGRYRYTKEFLNQINEQRAEFIDQIYPDIFKAYCYCMNGKYWDPEKYFDIIQFPGEYDKIPNKNNRSYNNNNNSNNNTSGYQQKQHYHQQQNQQQRRRNTSTSNYNKSNLLTPSTSVLSTADSPQPLQVPKNSPKLVGQQDQPQQQHRLNMSANSQKNNKENKKRLNNILSTLGVDSQSVKSNDADKILLNLIKNKEPQQQVNKCNDLLEILNTKKEQFDQNRQQRSVSSNNILENLFPTKTSPQQQVVPQMTSQAPKHSPLVLTAQELEMSQLLTQQKNYKPKLPNATSDLNRFDDLSNTSDAYKQLVKNLSNHPLNSSNNSLMTKLNQEQRLKQQQYQQQQWSNDGTNVLRQLLNLNPEITQNKLEKKTKKKHHHHHHHHKTTKSPSTSLLNPNQTKFPSQNPHEKPFENFFGNSEETRDSKHVEIVVASTLNHVLNKSPQTNNKNTLENLFEKMNMQQQKRKTTKSENEHFNSLLNKMMPQSSQSKVDNKKVSESSSDILKWFTGSSSTTTATTTKLSPNVLSEIEFMEMHQPKVLNKLY